MCQFLVTASNVILLTDLLKSSVTFGWGSEQEAAFTTLKRLITTSPILIYLDFNDPFNIITDVSSDR